MNAVPGPQPHAVAAASIGGPAAAPLAASHPRASRAHQPRRPALRAASSVLRNPQGTLGLGILLALVLVAIAAPLLAPYDPLVQNPGKEMAPPSGAFLLGTDNLGRDLLSRIIFGSRASLLVGVLAVALGATVGIGSGLLAGFLGGWLDAVLMRAYDALLAFPAILLGIGVVAVLGPGILNVALAIALAQMPDFARLTRALVIGERRREYVEAARNLGAGSGRIMVRHVLPNTVAPLLVQVSLAMGFAILAEAALSFLGLGTQPPTPSWGGMLNDSRQYLRQAPWYGVWPGVALASLLIGLNFLSDALRDALDPRRVGLR